MTNSKALLSYFIKRITISESKAEVESIALMALEEIYGITRSDILLNKPISNSAQHQEREASFITRINANEPIQHIVGHAFFLGRKFTVNKNVLIPRPETEELVLIAIQHLRKKQNVKVLDIATGSGCIPISLSLEADITEIYGTDISEEALSVASENNATQHASVSFIKHDILTEGIPFSHLDLITSNPPYIAQSEMQGMQKQVVDFEPHLALFVPDNDPLMFYKAIAEKSYIALASEGMLAVEINQRFGQEVRELFRSAGFGQIKLLQDLSGNDRVVTGIK